MTDISNKRTFTDPFSAAGSIKLSVSLAKLKSMNLIVIKTTKMCQERPYLQYLKSSFSPGDLLNAKQ